MLTAEGASVAQASGGEEALPLLRALLPALVITDVNMPGEDGLWLLNHVRHLLPGTPVVGVSGLHDPLDARKAGFDGFLQKPYKFEDLRATARSLLDAIARRNASVRSPSDATPRPHSPDS